MTDATPGSATPSLADGPPDDAAALLGLMWRIRLFEDEVRDLFTLNLIRGSTHLCQGQEATEVGVCSVLRPGDTMTCSYRGHGAVIAMGAPLDRCFGEILGRAGGLCGGRGGSMHLTDVSVGALGSNAIVGAHLPITVGAALSAQHLQTGAVSIAFFGDGATNIGAFHESLNLAAVWRLPAIFVIENNQYGEYSPLASTTPITRLADRATSYGIPGVFVDGNDIVAVRAVAGEAVERARRGEGPTLIEANTYRQQGHSRSDLAAYRPPGELERWMARDPITLLESALRLTADSTGASDRQLEQIRSEAAGDVTQAKERALSWPEPAAEERLKYLYA
jgi:acetoin:2,6-dichlorophenolindophenol oxidoreductase subunit alpha